MSTANGKPTKAQRQHRIALLLGKHSVTSQPQLVDLLADEGIMATQTTVSRDLEDLGAVKVRVPGGETVYAIPEYEPDRLAPHDHLRRVLSEWVVEAAAVSEPRRAAHAPGLRTRRCVCARPQRARGTARHGRGRRHLAVRRRREDGWREDGEDLARPRRPHERLRTAERAQWQSVWCSRTAEASTPPCSCVGCRRRWASRRCSACAPTSVRRRPVTGTPCASAPSPQARPTSRCATSARSSPTRSSLRR